MAKTNSQFARRYTDEPRQKKIMIEHELAMYPTEETPQEVLHKDMGLFYRQAIDEILYMWILLTTSITKYRIIILLCNRCNYLPIL